MARLPRVFDPTLPARLHAYKAENVRLMLHHLEQVFGLLNDCDCADRDMKAHIRHLLGRIETDDIRGVSGLISLAVQKASGAKINLDKVAEDNLLREQKFVEQVSRELFRRSEKTKLWRKQAKREVAINETDGSGISE